MLLKCRNQKGPEATGTRVGLLRGSTGLGLLANGAKTRPEMQSIQHPLAPFIRYLSHNLHSHSNLRSKAKLSQKPEGLADQQCPCRWLLGAGGGQVGRKGKESAYPVQGRALGL